MTKVITAILTAIIIFTSCKDSNPIVDTQNNSLPDYGTVVVDTLIAVEATYQMSDKVSSALGSRLQIGRTNDFEARILLRFITLPADTIELDSVYIRLRTIANLGEFQSPFTAKVYRVTNSWDATVNGDEAWNYADNIDPVPLAEFTITNDDSDYYKINIPDSVVSIWQDTTDGGHNFGLFVDYDGADFVKEFGSENSSEVPQIVYVYQNATNDSTIRDTAYAYIDASIFNYTGIGQLGPDSLIYIGSGQPFRAFIKFDMSEIPDNVILSHANFVFEKDSVNSLLSENKSQNFRIRTAITPIEQLPYFEVDSTFSTNIYHDVLLSEQDDNYLGLSSVEQGETAQYFLQSIINKEVNYQSFMVQYYDEGSGISAFAIKGVSDIVLGNRPKLIVEYFVIPSPRI